ncbi:Fur family transcriptional regulator [Pontiella agarivorans]|uniref:Fur family transcriptional regulator n=1 Tax=Pontiella agarivorans TaxID=3038953 RepID=A0ABU5MVQ7_9BACT|nr:Fur family transcriptional regulator [Pontiella agarivorans]MDZ8118309.1 Fur family transcriptional regulator [Pontiella agarivorans]
MHKIDPAEIEQRLGQLTETCRANGLRMTHQRMEIFREVAASGEHPDADTIFKRVRKRLPTISPDTVYRTLASLEETGLISRVNPVCGRARFDANTDEHHHYICTKCGKITDIYLSTPPALPEGIENLGEVESLHLQVHGVCHNCKSS